ncbi:MAG: diguanylate cyclase [Clostridiaceae bacterium]|nr:diguanylate cyclase [Clostridiaceae bacterium]
MPNNFGKDVSLPKKSDPESPDILSDYHMKYAVLKIKLLYFVFAAFVILREMLINTSNAWSKQRLLWVSIVSSLAIIVVVLVYSLVASRYHHQKSDVDRLIAFETAVLLIMSLTLIWFTGKSNSYFLVAFILILIPSTIQLGAYVGYLLTIALALFILFLDFLHAGTGISPYFIEKDLIIIVVFFITVWITNRFLQTDRERILELETKANIDGLSGLYNHRYFHSNLSAEVQSCMFLNQPLTLLFLDLDAFKEFNDRFGHINGDRIIARIAQIMSEKAPKGAILSRYGGDEFAAILPNYNKDEALRYGELVREAVEATDMVQFISESSVDNAHMAEGTSLTISVGIAQWNDHTPNAMALIQHADDALYRAKLFRKNRVEVYDSILDVFEMDLEQEDYELLRSLQALINIINARDRYTSGHVERVVMYSKALGQELGLEADQRKSLSLAAYMHDIGKVNLSENVLNKSTPLNDYEWQDIKQHSVVGARILKEVAMLSSIAPLVLHHHERYDGSGYPEGLTGDQIPFLSRVLTVVDSFDAMTFDRPYKAAMSYTDAIAELRSNKGRQFDPDIVESFIRIIERSLEKKQNGKS